jgi:hypothetical protein
MASGAYSYLESTLWDVANEACDKAVGNAQGMLRTLRGGRQCFFPKVDMKSGRVGIGINPEYGYLIYQEGGFQSFTMKWALGRVVKMTLPDGKTIYRKCTNLNQFRSGSKNYWYRDETGQLVPRYQQRRSWVHPGLPPKRFMQDAVTETVEQEQHLIDRAMLMDEYEWLDEKLDWGSRWHQR